MIGVDVIKDVDAEVGIGEVGAVDGDIDTRVGLIAAVVHTPPLGLCCRHMSLCADVLICAAGKHHHEDAGAYGRQALDECIHGCKADAVVVTLDAGDALRNDERGELTAVALERPEFLAARQVERSEGIVMTVEAFHSREVFDAREVADALACDIHPSHHRYLIVAQVAVAVAVVVRAG